LAMQKDTMRTSVRTAKKRYKKKFCELCVIPNPYALEVHRIYDETHYPKLKANPKNFVTLCKHHHRGDRKKLGVYGFHVWNGGNDKEANMDKWNRYVKEVQSKQLYYARITIVVLTVILIILKEAL